MPGVETDDALADTAGRVAVTLKSTAVLSASHDLSAPLPPQVRESKVRSKAATLLGEDASVELGRIVDTLPSAGVSTFADFLARQTI